MAAEQSRIVAELNIRKVLVIAGFSAPLAAPSFRLDTDCIWSKASLSVRRGSDATTVQRPPTLQSARTDGSEKPPQPFESRAVKPSRDLHQDSRQGPKPNFLGRRRDGAPVQKNAIADFSRRAGQQVCGVPIQGGTGAPKMLRRGRDPFGGKPEFLEGRPMAAQAHAGKARIGVHFVFQPGFATADEESAQLGPRNAKQRPRKAQILAAPTGK
jgi:hypothetical protein